MSAPRRSTRAASRAASSRGTSPAISEQDIPATPSARRTTRRSAASPLPAVGLRTSTAYGTNSTAQPSSMRGPDSQDPITNVLTGLLDPVREEDDEEESSPLRNRTGGPRRGKGSRRGGSATSATPATDRSFAHESGIFGEAGIDSSSYVEESGLETIQENPAAKESVVENTANGSVVQNTALENQTPIVTEIARNTRVEGAHEQAATAPGLISRFISQAGELVSAVLAYVMSSLLWLRSLLKRTRGISVMTIFAIAVIFITLKSQINTESIRWYGPLDVTHNIGQFIPYAVAHPLSAFRDGGVQDLHRRVTALEYDIAHLKTRTDLDAEAVSRLEEVLPDFIVCKQDEQGNMQIPDNFWHALQDKIRSDKSLFETQISETATKARSSTGLSKKEVISIAQKQAENVFDKSSTKNWEKFLNSNRAKIISWSGEEFDKQMDSMRKDVITSKSDFMRLIEKNWMDTKEEIQTQLDPQRKMLDLTLRRLTKLEENAVGVTRDEARAIALEVSKKLISTAQLDSLARANLQSSASGSLLRVNHFSPGTGAVVNPSLTSPNYVFPSMQRNTLFKIASWIAYRPVPVPNPPEAALSRWEEHGDCWCSPVRDSDGSAPRLAVITSNNIYPDQVVVEHIPTTAALEPGAAPREMELLAFIDDVSTYRAIKARSDEIFVDEAQEEEQPPPGFVRVGTWTYDIETMQNIQSFPVQVDLKMFAGRSYTRHLIVRMKNNWGAEKTDYTCLYRVRVNGEIAQPEEY